MSESTTPAQCRDEDWNLARDCGLMGATPGTNAWDAALGRFADCVSTNQSASTRREIAIAATVCPEVAGYTPSQVIAHLTVELSAARDRLIAAPAPASPAALSNESVGQILRSYMAHVTDAKVECIANDLRLLAAQPAETMVYYGGSKEPGPVSFDDKPADPAPPPAATGESSDYERGYADARRDTRFAMLSEGFRNPEAQAETDWTWCYENPRDAAAEIDRLQSVLAEQSATPAEPAPSRQQGALSERKAFEQWLDDTSGFTQHDEGVALAAWKAALSYAASATRISMSFAEATDIWNRVTDYSDSAATHYITRFANTILSRASSPRAEAPNAEKGE